MAPQLDLDALHNAFKGRIELEDAVKAAANFAPAFVELFDEISIYINALKDASASSEHASKKRRPNEDIPSRIAPNRTNGHSTTTNGAAVIFSNATSLLSVKEISVTIPQRKKCTIHFSDTHIYATLPDAEEPFQSMAFAFKDIDYGFCLPPSTMPEPFVFTISDTALKAGMVAGDGASTFDDYKDLFDYAIHKGLKSVGKEIKITRADEKLFHSVQKQLCRPGEKAVWVKSYRGSKDGYMFFLPTGILWGFRKPLMFVPHSRIIAISYTNVLTRTFNLSVEVAVAGAEGEEMSEEIEFEMIDQEDYGGIESYIKRYGLEDRSLAKQRKAKHENVNVVKDEDNNVIGNAEAGDLAAAAELAEDEEDEEEEDYDPGSEGDSEGSGTSDEESDEEGGDAEDDKGNKEE
ncbi:hypothetical protein BJ878DRAFT_456608 [Calycina marina]|uniref:Histone chaperone RTT106/FACT complex subunit SPT16-like middle domain-containing protein n=1 Tax=Calycina marina TaxID=1763456 RepID=A0A9P8CGJ6_9HELO|nr:hypothetical protein BJ878DRAFT_456608 [Calycina marina]